MFSRKSAKVPEKTSTITPAESDILCGKDKSYAKHPGNRVFRERIEAMKASYCAALNKQDKMTITRDTVTFMQERHGSRFLKMEGGVWVEIPEQAARDKVSHALRFSARKPKAETKSSTVKRSAELLSAQPRKRRAHSDDTSITSSISNRSEDASERYDHDAFVEPVPFAQVFGLAAAIFSRKVRHQQDEDDFVSATRCSFGSMNLLGEEQDDPNRPFLTLRSDELDEILKEPLDVDEWEAVAEMAK